MIFSNMALGDSNGESGLISEHDLCFEHLLGIVLEVLRIVESLHQLVRFGVLVDLHAFRVNRINNDTENFVHALEHATVNSLSRFSTPCTCRYGVVF